MMPSSKAERVHATCGVSRDVIEYMSSRKREPEWMLAWRLRALEHFERMEKPSWGVDLDELDITNMCFYSKPFDEQARTWDEVPPHIRQTFDALGIPHAEHDALAGVGAQFESEMLYKSLKESVAARGVIFCSLDEAVECHGDLLCRHLGTVVGLDDNIFAALNAAVWSGGCFIYVPRSVHVELPLHAYFRVHQERMGQCERTLIIAEEGSNVHYLEACSAPLYTTHALHCAVVEIVVANRACVRYTTMQNWSKNMYNLVTKRAHVGADARIEWVDGNFGARATMKYPCMVLNGAGARGTMISLAFAGDGQHQHTGAKVIHRAPNTTATVHSKSVCHDGGITGYAGTVVVEPWAHGSQTYVNCDALMLDDRSRATSQPCVDVKTCDAHVGHEASVKPLDERAIFCLQSRGIRPKDARMLVIHGFTATFVSALPLEYSLELDRLIEHELGDSRS